MKRDKECLYCKDFFKCTLPEKKKKCLLFKLAEGKKKEYEEFVKNY